MARTTPQTDDVGSAPTDAAEGAAETMKLQEFCLRLSETVKSPELIAGFYHVELVSGVTSDSLDAYKARFELFRNLPV